MSKIMIRVILIFIGLILFGGLVIGYIIMNNNQIQDEEIVIEFITKKMNSCPNSSAWFIINVNSEIKQNIPTITFSTNVSIHYNYKLWSTNTPSVLEVFLYPNTTHIGQTIELEVKIKNSTDFAILNVWDWQESEFETANEKLSSFINYFTYSKPEFSIDNTTTWESSCNDAGILIVEHFLFKSENWELELSWHVMISPYDWVKVYLRPRDQIHPTWGGTIDSWNGDSPINETEPPQNVYRPQ